MIKVSVIIPVFNSEKFLEHCLMSVIKQTLQDIEIICIDDGSTDSSLEILRRYEKKDSRIIVIEQENQGAGCARNQGLSIARGKYLSFLDSDDFFEQDMLYEAFLSCENTCAEICVFESDLFDVNTQTFKYCDWSFNKKYFPDHMPFTPNEESVKDNIFRMFTGWAWDKLFLREFVERNGIEFQELRTTNDMFFVYYALTKAKAITTLPKVFAHQRVNIPHSLSNTREKSWNCFYLALLYLKERLTEDNNESIYKKAYVNWALNLSLWHLNTISDRASLKVFHLLKQEGFEKLGITIYDATWFYVKQEYEQMCRIQNSTVDEYLIERLENAREKERLLQENLKKKEEEVKTLTVSLDNKKWQLEQVYQSKTYRLGEFLLYIPKKIKKRLGE